MSSAGSHRRRGHVADLATHEHDIQHLYTGFAKLKEEVNSQQIALARIKRPWYHNASVMVSVLAFIFSLGTTTFAYFQTRQQRVHDLRTEVRTALLQFNQLAIDALKAEEQYRGNPTFSSLLADRAGGTLAMLAVRISELAMEIPEHISVKEHLAIATVLHSADRPSIAALHTGIALGRTTDPQERVEATRMLALLAYSALDLPSMRHHFEGAVKAAHAIDPIHLSHWSKLGTFQLWSERELIAKQCAEFAELLKRAGDEYLKLPGDLQRRKAGELEALRSQVCAT